MRRSSSLLVVLPAFLLAGCPDGVTGGGGGNSCSPEAERTDYALLMRQWYLYPELLPARVDPQEYASTAEMIDAMTAEARSQGLDRGWTYVTTASASQAFFEEGTSVGAGLGLLLRPPDRLWVSQVYPGSAAAAAGFGRGDRILRIGETEATLAPVAAAVAAGLADPDDTSLAQMIGPPTAGLVRVLEVIPAGESLPVVRTVTKGTFGLDPVPAVGDGGERWRIFDRGGAKLGYVALRTFISTADDPLARVFQAFHDAGVTGVVVDLRYNGGGLVSTGTLLSNLLGGGITGAMWRFHHNPARAAANDRTESFAPPAGAVTATRLAFITTGASASASELVPNVLEPYLHGSVALVGARTYGKPVGQRLFQRSGCDTLVAMVAFSLQNAEEDGAYFGGLPDLPVPPATEPRFSGKLCEAPDDLTNALGSEAEASTAAALTFLETGACPAPAPAPAAKPGRSAARPPDAYPAAVDPSLAQRHVGGLF